MTDEKLLGQLAEFATSIGYEIAIDDKSANPELVFLRRPDGVVFSLLVQQVGS